ncbi:MAG TPA: VOC family protein [Phycisphaerae bacterium]|nr:VOC family protein [Phycisphaerae bacterium]
MTNLRPLMLPEIGAFDHVGVAVTNLDQAVEFYIRVFGAEAEPQEFVDPLQEVSIRFVRLAGMRIELLQPTGAGSHLQGILKRGIGLYHVCHQVRELDRELERLRVDGVRIISEPKPAVAFNGRRVAFTMYQGFMLELLEADAADVAGKRSEAGNES